jgi:MFS family permease
VALGLMMVLLDTSIVSVANATIGKDLHGSLAGLQWVTDAFLLAIATGLVAGGKLGDHYGRRRLFSWGAAGFALSSAGAGCRCQWRCSSGSAPRRGWRERR